MALLVDDYTVKSRNDIIFNKDVYNRVLGNIPDPRDIVREKQILDNIEGNSFEERYMKYHEQKMNAKRKKLSKIGNLIVHGFNKSTFIDTVLYELYGEAVKDTRMVTYNIESYTSKEKTISIEQSMYHVQIIANGTSLDKITIQEIVKTFDTKQFTKKEHFIKNTA